MTRKDYNKIAHAIRYYNTLDNLVAALCLILENDNPSFDRVRFVKACGF